MPKYTTRKKDIKRSWHLLNAEEQILGRLATKISNLLTGKEKPYFVPHLDCGDFVVVVNAKDMKVTGQKLKKKVYYRHSGYPGGLKAETLEHLLERKPEEVVRRAVWGMLPKNKLRKKRMARLYIYPGRFNHGR